MVDGDILFTASDISRWTGMFTLGTMLGYGNFGRIEIPQTVAGGAIIATSLGAGAKHGYEQVYATIDRSAKQAAAREILGYSTTTVGLEEIMQNKKEFLRETLRGSADLYLPLAAGFVFGLYLKYT
jgi:hypothetical protein